MNINMTERGAHYHVIHTDSQYGSTGKHVANSFAKPIIGEGYKVSDTSRGRGAGLKPALCSVKSLPKPILRLTAGVDVSIMGCNAVWICR
jgi:DNA topoisomerase VI subunit B